MQILVTGAHGKVGAATIHELVAAGHTVTGCDVVAPVYEGGDFAAHYVQADLTDAVGLARGRVSTKRHGRGEKAILAPARKHFASC